jgi:hypothetical protein
MGARISGHWFWRMLAPCVVLALAMTLRGFWQKTSFSVGYQYVERIFKDVRSKMVRRRNWALAQSMLLPVCTGENPVCPSVQFQGT